MRRRFLMIIILLALLFSILICLFIFQQGPIRKEPAQISFSNIQVSNENPRVYDTVELEIRVNGSVENPFDEHEVNVTSEVLLPNGEKQSIQAFFYQDYERSLVNDAEVLTPLGKPFWKLRLTPILEGNHEINLHLYSRGKLVDSHTLSIKVEGYSQNPGFTRLNGNYLVSDDGSDLFLVGQNVCWYTASRKTYDYDAWFEKMAENGMNYARIWMAPWAFGLEWSDKAGRYDLKEAWRLDYVLQLAEKKGIHVMLC